MKKYIFILIIVVVAACQTNQQKETETDKEKYTEVKERYSLLGDWQFLNKQGAYTESYFSEKYFKVFNRQMGMSPNFKYDLVVDTLFTSITQGDKVSRSKSEIIWLNENKVIMKARFGADTMDRILTNELLLGNTDLRADSLNFSKAYWERNKTYLLERGIITKEEVEAFEKENIIPDDVKEKMEK